MAKRKKPIIVEVRGGNVQGVWNVPRGYEWQLLDWDNLLPDTYTTGNLVQRSCSGADTQKVTLHLFQPLQGYYQFQDNNPSGYGWFMSDSNPGTLVTQSILNDTNQEYFNIEPIPGNLYRIHTRQNDNCIDVVGASGSSGAKIEENTCDGSLNQKFQVTVM